MEIYPSYIMIFLIFNLLGWWYKGQPFFSWWWFVPIAVLQIIISSLILAITKRMLEVKR
jgi:hypothetical protein